MGLRLFTLLTLTWLLGSHQYGANDDEATSMTLMLTRKEVRSATLVSTCHREAGVKADRFEIFAQGFSRGSRGCSG